jgi:DNA polymerase-3 subunit delta
MRLWPPTRAAAAMTALNEAEARMKTTGLPAETICREALLRIARGAAAAAARAR